MTVHYVVPSRSRPSTVGPKTLTTLRAAGVPAAAITLVVDSDQAEQYEQQVDPALYGQLRVMPGGGEGVHIKRNYTMRMFPIGTRLVTVDDDLSGIYQARDRSTRNMPVLDLPAVAEWAFAVCDKLGLGLWGVYPVNNPYFMRPEATTDLRYIAGCLCGLTVRGDDTELVTQDDKEDFERSIKHTIRDGGVLRLNWVTYATRYYDEPGGIQDYRTPERVEDRALRLAAMYPDYCTFVPGGGSHRSQAEVRLRRGKPVAPPIPAPEHA